MKFTKPCGCANARMRPLHSSTFPPPMKKILYETLYTVSDRVVWHDFWFIVTAQTHAVGSTSDIIDMCSPFQVQAVAVVGDSVSGTSLVIPSAQMDRQGQDVRMDTADVQTVAFGNLVTATVSESM